MFEPYILIGLFVIGILSACFIGQCVINVILTRYCRRLVKKTKTRFDNEVFPLIKRLLGISIWCSGIVAILFKFNIIDLSGLATTVGISSILITMLVKESVANIVGGITLMFDRPFRVGDTIKLPSGDSGEIIKIGLRRTSIEIPKDEDGRKSILIIPNKDLTKTKVYNYTLAKERDNDKKETEVNSTGDLERD